MVVWSYGRVWSFGQVIMWSYGQVWSFGRVWLSGVRSVRLDVMVV